MSEQLTIKIEFINRDNGTGSLGDGFSSDGKKKSTPLQDFFQELLVDAVVGSFQLLAVGLHHFLLLRMLKLADDGSGTLSIVFIPS